MTTDFPTKDKQRATRRKHKVAKRSPYARELETDKYRQRIKPHKTYDDWSWMDDIEEYYGQRNLETQEVSPQSDTNKTPSHFEDEGRDRSRDMVEETSKEARTKGSES